MDWDRVQGSWKQLTGRVKEKWGKLTDDDLTAINGRRDHSKAKSKSAMELPRIKFGGMSTTGLAGSKVSPELVQPALS